VGWAVFKVRPTREDVTAALDRIMVAEGSRPKHLIVDQGPEFKCEHFENVWCKAKNILPRFGAVGKHGSTAVVERFHRTLKEILRLITVPEDQAQFEREVGFITEWYNECRPHDTLGGKTPNEIYFSRPPANEQPRIESRQHWPRGSPCAEPGMGIEGEPGDPFILEIRGLEGRRHLPVIDARRAT
jgi:putative transposase